MDEIDVDPVREGLTTMEHENLSQVVQMLVSIESMRAGGAGSDQIADRLAVDYEEPPGGGRWTGAKVDRIIDIVESIRSERDTTSPPTPAGHARPGQRAVEQADELGTTPPPRPTPPAASQAVAAAQTAQPPRPIGRHDRFPNGAAAAGHPAPSAASADHHRMPAASPMAGRTAPAGAGAGAGTGAAGVFLVTTPSVDDGAQVPPAGGMTWHAEAERAPRPRRWRWLAAGVVVLSLAGGGAYAATRLDDLREMIRSDDPPADTAQGDSASPSTTEAPDPADMMAIRIDPAAPGADDQDAVDAVGGTGAATATIRNDGLLHLEGAFTSQDEADRFIAAASQVFGADNIVESYTIDPDAPVADVSDVALDKPVLFESGSATIDPSYIPFLEACGDVLRLNPHIVMSITAFTDSVGDEEFNLDLSRQRAEAIVEFYRSLDIDDSQLIGVGFGEDAPVGDNDTEDGRSANRRAMLALLGIMDDDGQESPTAPDAGEGTADDDAGPEVDDPGPGVPEATVPDQDDGTPDDAGQPSGDDDGAEGDGGAEGDDGADGEDADG